MASAPGERARARRRVASPQRDRASNHVARRAGPGARGARPSARAPAPAARRDPQLPARGRRDRQDRRPAAGARSAAPSVRRGVQRLAHRRTDRHRRRRRSPGRGRCGADRRDRSTGRRSRRFAVHPRELEAIGARPAAARRSAFFDCWVRKEAYLKGRGTGFTRDATKVSVPLDPAGGVIDDALAAATASPWTIHPLRVDRGIAAAVACSGETTVVTHGLDT